MAKAMKDILTKTVLVVAVIMQVLATTPHHHHDDNTTPCVGFFHHTADEYNDQHCCHHDHHNDSQQHDNMYNNGDIPFALCNIHNIIISSPERPEKQTEAVCITLPDDCSCCYRQYAYHSINAGGNLMSSSGGEDYYRIPVHVGLPVMRYIAVALAPRAPDSVS